MMRFKNLKVYLKFKNIKSYNLLEKQFLSITSKNCTELVI